MATRFRSISRVMCRGYLRVNYKPVVTGEFEDIGNPITGSQLVPKVVQVPFLERRTSTDRKKWVTY